MKQHRIQLAVGQMLVVGGQPAANLGRAVEMVHEAASAGCQVIVLPECLDIGWTHPAARELAAPIPGAHCDALVEAARVAHIMVAAGLTERDGDRIFNAAVLIDGQGRLLLTYRKINVMDIAQPLYHIGDRLGVAATPLGRVGLNICADNFPNSRELGNVLGRMGARILLSPSAWAVEADHDNQQQAYGQLWRDAYRPLARQFKMPIVGVSSVGKIDAGPWAGRKCIGCSLVVDGEGQEVAQGPYDREALMFVQLTLPGHQPQGTCISGTL
jgi:predicted amidohydrolase